MAVNAGKPNNDSLRIACGLAMVCLLLLSGWLPMVLAVTATLAACFAVGALARAQIGGQTGDVLGACQQVTEICILLALAVATP